MKYVNTYHELNFIGPTAAEDVRELSLPDFLDKYKQHFEGSPFDFVFDEESLYSIAKRLDDLDRSILFHSYDLAKEKEEISYIDDIPNEFGEIPPEPEPEPPKYNKHFSSIYEALGILENNQKYSEYCRSSLRWRIFGVYLEVVADHSYYTHIRYEHLSDVLSDFE